MKPYDHKAIEKKWQKYWESKKLFHTKENSKKKKFYPLIEFPYPSGDGLHVGHIRSNTAMDIIARKRRMEGFEVLYPIGWDAFGLPTENFAIKTGKQPALITKENTDTFRRQLKALGFSFDWSREINTTDPAYYKWTQWIFLKFLEKGLAYKKKMAINWCPKDKIGLANEEVIDGLCERCGTPVEKREKEQWMLAITKYADRLDKDLDLVDFLPQIKQQQRNWIGRSEGAEIRFKIQDSRFKKEIGGVTVFTTRPDTIFGATYLVLSPEHPEIKNHESSIENYEAVKTYIETTKKKTDIERTGDKEKTGVRLEGVVAINPATKEEIPIFVADHVLSHVGTGAIMAVPAHDKRDFEFAKKFKLPIKYVVLSGGSVQAGWSLENYADEWNDHYQKMGKLINSGKFDGRNSDEVTKEITEFVSGKIVTTYKLRDWVFSRQRYWGEPIPVIHCEKCGVVPVPEKELPVKLPAVKNYVPTETGESPLSSVEKWVNVKCPKCKGKAKRETDTMPNWAGSSWYYLRYTDPKNKKMFAGEQNLKYWTPVDWYNGGMEHTTLHLLYSRFWHKFLYDLKLVPTSEPYQKRTSHGLILAEGGVKMSKSKGNVVNPDTIVETVGADSLRLYEMFMGPFDQAIAWDTQNIAGVRRFIERVWHLHSKIDPKQKVDTSVETVLHQTIKKVGEDIEMMKCNTAISALMILLNTLEKETSIAKSTYETLLQLLSPFAPHVSEELWALLGNKKSLAFEAWPAYDETKLVSKTNTIVIQVNGKVRAEMMVEEGQSEDEIKAKALALPELLPWISGKEVKRMIYVKGRLLNLVV